MLSDIEIAQASEMLHIRDIAARVGIDGDELEFYGNYKAKIPTEIIKKAEKYEDSYLEELFDVLADAGVPGVTYMPSRNTDAQIVRLQEQCRRHGIREISGEDINSPRQGFICEKLAEPGFRHLVDAAWDLVHREERD